MKNVFFVKVACNSGDVFKHTRREESAAGSSLRFSTHHLCLLELWVLTGSLISPFFPFAIRENNSIKRVNTAVVVVCKCICSVAKFL